MDTLPQRYTSTKALVVEKPGAAFVLQDVILGELRPKEILVEMKYTGICHTDLVVKEGYMPMGSFPAVLGHEGAGVIRQLGEDLKGSNSDLQVGDRVILGYSSCMACSSCENGRKGACERIAETNFVGTRGGKDEDSAIHLPLDGHDGGDDSDGSGRSVRSLFFGQSSFSKLAVVDVRSVIKYPGPTEDLAFLAPLGCGYMTGAATVLNVLKPKPTSTVAIVGLGAVGLSALMAAKYAKVEQILAVDIVESRLRQAASLGATKCADSSKYDTVQDVIREVFPRGADYIIDATGLKSIIVSGVRALAHGGTFAIVGMPRPHEILEIDALDMLTQCKTLIGITGGYCDPQQFIPRLVEMYQAGAFPIDSLHKTYQLRELEEAIGDMKSGKVVKPVLAW